MIFLLIWVAVLLAVAVAYFRQLNSRFSKYGVKFATPLPIFGNTFRILFRIDHVVNDMLKLYNRFPNERFVGRFEFSNELVMIRDLELAKQISIKDFDYFHDHRSIFNESSSFFSRNLFSLHGQEWKDMRCTLSPAFTSSKIRAMVPFMVEVGDQMITMLKKKFNESKTDFINVECRDLTSRYANDVIASCAFGLKVNSHLDPDNEFYTMSKLTSTFGFRQMIMIFTMLNLPKVAKFMKWDFPPEQSKKFFITLVAKMMKEREVKQIIRPDMIHLLMESKKGRLTHEAVKTDEAGAGFATVKESDVGSREIKRVWSDLDLTAQAMLFFVAGFETVSTGMCLLLYELAIHPEIQTRLANEIKENDVKNEGKLDFNSIQNMTYLDMVISELLRLWPTGAALDRECTKDYNLGKPNKDAKEDFIIRKGTAVGIPVFAFHRDPAFFPDPMKFDPERFSEENRHKIHPFAYMPFGVGPRNCIGSRFALCEMKVMTYQILLHMEVSPSETTCIPAQLSTESFNIRLKGGYTFRFKLRD